MDKNFSKRKNEVANILSDLLKSDKERKLATDDLNADLSDAIPTGILPFDLYLGGGLFPGRIYEIAGAESQGKTTMVHTIAAGFQRWSPNHVVVIIETENAIDKVRAQAIGMDLDRTIISEADLVEEGFAEIKRLGRLIREKLPEARVLFIWDTIAAAATKAEKENGQYSGGIAEKPRIIRSALRDITGELGENGDVLIFLNQVYDSMGYLGGLSTPGGRGIKHHTSVRLMVKKKDPIIQNITVNGKQVQKHIGNLVEFKMLKNKISQPDLAFNATMFFETGFQKFESMINTFMSMNPMPSEVVVGGAGWATINFPEEITKTITSKNTQIKVQGTNGMLKELKNSLFLRLYVEYLCFKGYVEQYSLMKMKYRNLVHQKYINVLKGWNKEFEKFGGKAIDEKSFPPPPPQLTSEELREINQNIIYANSDLEFLKE